MHAQRCKYHFHQLWTINYLSLSHSLLIDYNHVLLTLLSFALMQARDIIQAVKDFNGIGEGETSADGLFTLSEVECLGACVNAPMIQVNNEYFYEDLTYDSMTQLMQDWKDGKEPQVGPQNGRFNSCGIEGRTSLHGEPQGAITRDFAAEKARYDEAKAAAAAAAKR